MSKTKYNVEIEGIKYLVEKQVFDFIKKQAAEIKALKTSKKDA